MNKNAFEKMKSLILVPIILLQLFTGDFALAQGALPQGDANGDGAVSLADAKLIAENLAGINVIALDDGIADVTQNGQINVEDVQAIVQQAQGRSCTLVVRPLNGVPGDVYTGSIVRIEVAEHFLPFEVLSGSVRITSQEAGYDSGEQSLSFENNGRLLYYQWNTTGLTPAQDYVISVSLLDRQNRVIPDSILTETVVLHKRAYGDTQYLAQVTDASVSVPGVALSFVRTALHDSTRMPYLGPLGYGWNHSYNLFLEENTDGWISMIQADGSSRWFKSNNDGTYTSMLGDSGTLVRDPSGQFQLSDADGQCYRFSANLRLMNIMDANGNKITCKYDKAGLLKKIVHSSGRSFSLTYNKNGRIKSLIDHAGRITTYEYDVTGMKLVSVTNSAGIITQYTYVSGEDEHLNNRLQVIAAPDGVYTHFAYDDKANLISQCGTWGANPVARAYNEDGTTHITDACGAITSVKGNDRGQATAIDQPDGQSTTIEYDTHGNVIKITNPLGNATIFDHDQNNMLIGITDPLGETVQTIYDSEHSGLTAYVDALNNRTTFTYDAHGNLTGLLLPDENTASFTNDKAGNLSSYTDEDACVTKFSYTRNGQLSIVKNALGKKVQLTYDKNGDLAKIKDAMGYIYSFSRDVLGRIIQITYPDNTISNYTYSDGGRMTSYTNRRGETLYYTYNVAGILEWKTFPSGEKLHYLYDDRGVLVSVERLDADDKTLTMDAWEYDLSGRLTYTRQSNASTEGTLDFSYAYDLANNRTFLSYPDGFGIRYEYDACNRVTRIKDSLGNLLAMYEYDARGNVVRRMSGNGTYVIYGYDSRNRLTGIRNFTADGILQEYYLYTHNASGDCTTITSKGGQIALGYDLNHQLISIRYPDGHTVGYTLDANGNRMLTWDNEEEVAYNVNKLNQYTQVGGIAYQYDENGNLTGRIGTVGSMEYEWDTDNHLTAVESNGKRIEYQYDTQGRLYQKNVDGSYTRYLWNQNSLVAEVDPYGNIVRRYIYGTDGNELIAVLSGDCTYWVQQDASGSITGLTGADGSILETATYDAYGNHLSASLMQANMGYAGMLWDADAGLYYVKARWYDPALGRFISPDLIGTYDTLSGVVYEPGTNYGDSSPVFSPLNLLGIAASPNRYLYALNNPFRYSDPTGLFYTEAGGSIGGYGSISATSEGTCSVGYGIGAGAYAVGMTGNATTGASMSGFVSIGGVAFAFSMSSDGISVGVGIGFGWGLAMSGGLGMSGGGGGGVGGGCPTFIQVDDKKLATALATRLDVSKQTLAAQITVPVSNALLRSDIPIYGVAGGMDFAGYRVEYGEGTDPDTWTLIEESSVPQNTVDVGLAEIQFMQGDMDLHGNLATWNTGLKNWEHLPWHPADDPVDLNGVYTLRLVVTGQNGAIVEDRVTVTVGRVIAQVLPGTAVSPDGLVTMAFPEQALCDAFRVYSILPCANTTALPAAPEGSRQSSAAYEIGEAGDRFGKDVTLTIRAENPDFQPENAFIAQYDAETKAWIPLPTEYILAGDTVSYQTVLFCLPDGRAVYTLFADSDAARSTLAQVKVPLVAAQEPTSESVLVSETFENGTGTWKARDRWIGASVAQKKDAGMNGTGGLVITNESYGGNFSVTLLDHSFDVREYSQVSFDYCVKAGVKTDFYLLVNNRWYNLGFTDDAQGFRNMDTNIDPLGQIEGIITDGQWHTASVDLYSLLRERTEYTQIDAIVMADWNVMGYMNLSCGTNARGAYYLIDNFQIAVSPAIRSDTLYVDDFESAAEGNLLGGDTGTFSNEGMDYISVDFAAAEGSRSKSLCLTYDATAQNAYCGYWSSLMSCNLINTEYLSFDIRVEGTPCILAGLRPTNSGAEATVDIRAYWSQPDAAGWRTVSIPLSAFREAGLTRLSFMDVVFLKMEQTLDSGKNVLYLDNLAFTKGGDQSGAYTNVNLLDIAAQSTDLSGAAAISYGAHTAMGEAGALDTVRISYGGSIGLGYGGREFSYCLWVQNLPDLNLREYQTLSLTVKGEKGGDAPHIYLDDGNNRRMLPLSQQTELTGEWQVIQIPLHTLEARGVDLSHVTGVQLVFEWAEMSGTVYISDIHVQ